MLALLVVVVSEIMKIVVQEGVERTFNKLTSCICSTIDHVFYITLLKKLWIQKVRAGWISLHV